EWSVVIQRMEGRNFDAVMAGWSTPLNSDPYQLWHSKNASTAGSSNFISFSNPEADKLIEELHNSFDDETRVAIYHKFHKLLHEEQPYLFLFSQDNLVAISGRYQNLRIFPLGLPKEILWTPRDKQRPVPGM
ncbi:MAG: peptide-binding protein, partial [Lentisphaeria bacterium]|nr:peptide-binding protein [Lentisphaeria bacterium]